MRSAAFGLVLLVGGGCGGAVTCKPGTLLLHVALPAPADELDVTLVEDGAPRPTQIERIASPASSGYVEIDFASRYPEGSSVVIEVAARRDGVLIGEGASVATLLPAGCARLDVSVAAADLGTGGDLAGAPDLLDAATADRALDDLVAADSAVALDAADATPPDIATSDGGLDLAALPDSSSQKDLAAAADLSATVDLSTASDLSPSPDLALPPASQVQVGTFCAAVAGCTTTLQNPTQAGNLLVLVVTTGSGSGPSVSPGTWTLAATRAAGPLGTAPAVYVFYRANSPAGIGSVAISGAGAGESVRAQVSEWAGPTALGSSGDATGTSTSALTVTAGPTTSSLGVSMFTERSSATAAVTFTPGAGWVHLGDNGASATTDVHATSDSFLAPAAGKALSEMVTSSLSGTAWVGVIVTFR